MLKGDWPRWVFTFTLLFVTVGWAGYVLQVIRWTISDPNLPNILQLSGASGLLGALTTLLTLAVQFFYRKAPPALPAPVPTAAAPAPPPTPPPVPPGG